jgi:hypothetical protein
MTHLTNCILLRQNKGEKYIGCHHHILSVQRPRDEIWAPILNAIKISDNSLYFHHLGLAQNMTSR